MFQMVMVSLVVASCDVVDEATMLSRAKLRKARLRPRSLRQRNNEQTRTSSGFGGNLPR
jgi:hypothetical protein